MFDKIADQFEKNFESVPGFSLVVAIIAALVAWSAHHGEIPWRELSPFVAVGIAYLIIRPGSLLDSWVDAGYGLSAAKRRLWLPWRNGLDKARESAAENLNCPLTGIYKKAAGILEGTEEWKMQVRWKLEVSKAARAFIIPSFVILVARLPDDLLDWNVAITLTLSLVFVVTLLLHFLWDISHTEKLFILSGAILLAKLLRHFAGAWLAGVFNLWVVGAVLLVCAVIYPWRRVVHMTKLYELAAEMPVSKHVFSARDMSDGKSVEQGLLRAGRSVYPLRMVAMRPEVESRFTKPELEEAEKLVRSLAQMDVEVYSAPNHNDEARNCGQTRELPIAVVMHKRLKPIIGDYIRGDPSLAGSITPDKLITIVRGQATYTKNAAKKERHELEKWLNRQSSPRREERDDHRPR